MSIVSLVLIFKTRASREGKRRDWPNLAKQSRPALVHRFARALAHYAPYWIRIRRDGDNYNRMSEPLAFATYAISSCPRALE